LRGRAYQRAPGFASPARVFLSGTQPSEECRGPLAPVWRRPRFPVCLLSSRRAHRSRDRYDGLSFIFLSHRPPRKTGTVSKRNLVCCTCRDYFVAETWP
jgi:hypothetical protein